MFHGDHITISVDRVECNPGRPGAITCLPEELLIPLKMSRKDIPARNFEQAAESLFRNLFTGHPNLELTTCLRLIGRMVPVGRSQINCVAELNKASSNIDHLSFDIIFMECPLSLTPMPVIPLINSALSRSLETSIIYPTGSPNPRNILDPVWDARFGYISLTNNSQYALHLDTDPTVHSSNLVGM
ncbi:unnamed protein product [Echinostoma caproni]|uniref:Uncharacterized protein n=1 Tax=Echinostoma caproni TaxID=27848 RepID=A0A183AW67_9TREM|nr:unnamed protein product [Echinostoma caproni]